MAYYSKKVVFFIATIKLFTYLCVRLLVATLKKYKTVSLILKKTTNMKKMLMALAAAMMMSANAMAQDDNEKAKFDTKPTENTDAARRDRRPFDRTEMIQRQTDETVKAYGLDEEQAAKLLALNTRYAEKRMPRMGRRPEGRPNGNFRQRDDAQASTEEAKADGKKQAEEMAGEGRPQMRRGNGDREEMRKVMEEYESEVQKIMTPEQFEKYKADRQKRFREGRRGFGERRGPGEGRRNQHRDNN